MVMRREDIAPGGGNCASLGRPGEIKPARRTDGDLEQARNRGTAKDQNAERVESNWQSARDSFPLMCVGVASLPTTGSLAARGNKVETSANYPYPNWRI